MVASIEAPFALLEKPMKIVRFDAIESSQMSFGLVPKVFDPVDVISPVGEELGMIDAHVMKFCDVECIVRLESVGVNNAVRSDYLFNDREQGFGSCVRHDSRKNLPSPLKQAEYSHFASCSSASFPFSDSTEITLISLDLPIQFVAGKLRGYEKSQPHVETNGRVGLDTNNLGSSSCRRPGYKVLQKPVLSSRRKTTFSYVHNSNYRLFSWS